MVKYVDAQERENEILGLVIDSYIGQSRPISSSYLKTTYNLPYSSATIRNVMESLEQQGFLYHVHISSGRVPTQAGFRYYVEHLRNEDLHKQYQMDIDQSFEQEASSSDEVMNHTLDLLAQMSGYTSLFAISGRDKKVFLRGTRFMLDQPEFEDLVRLRNLFYLFEVRMDALQELLIDCCEDEMRIFVGDDIGCDEMADCSLVVSGIHDKDVSFTLGLLGPMRMNYKKAASCLYSTREQFRRLIEDFVF